MKKPKSKLPWKMDIPELDYKGEANPHDGTYMIHNSTSENPWDGMLLTDRMYYNTAPESKQDADYILQACNNYPKAVELLRLYHKGASCKEKLYLSEVDEFLKEIGENL